MSEQILSDLQWFFEQRGGARYELGDPSGVNQLEHALQCAALAEMAGASDALITASLLHDLGHLVYEDDEYGDEMDDLHQYRALPLLRTVFDSAVLEPIKLHVDAKRYLCTVEHDYYEGLSEGSRRSLSLQGGPFSAAEASQFIAQPHARDAVLLRRWDDRSKAKGQSTPDLAHFLFIALRCMKEPDMILV